MPVWPGNKQPFAMQRCLLFPLLTLLLAFSLSSCLEDRCEDEQTFYVYDAVTITEAEWRTDNFVRDEAREVCEPSGFYVYGDLLLVVDAGAGLHLIDNSDNAAPTPIGFITMPGGRGLAVRNNVLYISQFTDILTFSLDNPREPRFLQRTRDVFTTGSVFAGVDGNGDYVIRYDKRAETVTRSCDEVPPNVWGGGGGWWLEGDVLFSANAFVTNTANAGATQPDVVGVGGSLARFTIANSTLYTVDDRKLTAFGLQDPTRPERAGEVNLGWGIETIFPQGDLLFVGAETGMHILRAADPLNPEYLSTFQHVRACDPVVVRGNLAYVTIWAGSDCGNSGRDQLEVIDISYPRDAPLHPGGADGVEPRPGSSRRYALSLRG